MVSLAFVATLFVIHALLIVLAFNLGRAYEGGHLNAVLWQVQSWWKSRKYVRELRKAMDTYEKDKRPWQPK